MRLHWRSDFRQRVGSRPLWYRLMGYWIVSPSMKMLDVVWP